MQAVVLVGGEGTRMRPLTETVPKPLLPLVDRPFLAHVLDRLAEHGVEEAILSSPFLEEVFGPFLATREGRLPRVVWITEPKPLGTAGAIANALDHLRDAFLVLNGDILTDLDLTRLAAYHRERGAVATIAVGPVEDARPYGLVEVGDDGRVGAFREKPADLVPGTVNMGAYVLEPVALQGVSTTRAVSIETEVFPGLVESKVPVYGFVSDAYWKDLGTPDKYLGATFDALEGRIRGLRYPAPFLAEDATTAASATVGPLAVIGGHARVGEGATVEGSVVFEGATVEAGARVRGSIVGRAVHVGERADVVDSVLAEGAVVPPGARADGERVPPFTVLET
ncbi:MAG TPA: NDP-sugar synthase [Actinomycetota bacterium]|nr:NDP-sugar synthase [Actinomycetota bacterium]